MGADEGVCRPQKYSYRLLLLMEIVLNKRLSIFTSLLLIFFLVCNCKNVNSELRTISLTLNSSGYLASIYSTILVFHYNDSLSIKNISDIDELKLYKKYDFFLSDTRTCHLDSIQYGSYNILIYASPPINSNNSIVLDNSIHDVRFKPIFISKVEVNKNNSLNIELELEITFSNKSIKHIRFNSINNHK